MFILTDCFYPQFTCDNSKYFLHNRVWFNPKFLSGFNSLTRFCIDDNGNGLANVRKFLNVINF